MSQRIKKQFSVIVFISILCLMISVFCPANLFAGYWTGVENYSGSIYPGQTKTNNFTAPEGTTALKVYLSWSCSYPYNDLDLYLKNPIGVVASSTRRWTTSETIYYYEAYDGSWSNDIYGYYFFWYPPEGYSGYVNAYIADECYEGSSTHTPWTGSWWPQYTGIGVHLYDPNGPMEKYDEYVSSGGLAQNWEYANHRTTNPSEQWFGHCHAWTNAAILESEATSSKVKDGITFTVGDQKGLVTEIHCADHTDLWVGERYDTGDPPAHYQDVYADDFHNVVIDKIGRDNIPLAMDIDPGVLVNNHPCYEYEMSYSADESSPSIIHVVATLKFADADVIYNPSYVGTMEMEKTYYYYLTGGILSPTGGGWEGVSVDDHPDFIWHPDYIQTNPYLRNPYVDEDDVYEIMD